MPRSAPQPEPDPLEADASVEELEQFGCSGSLPDEIELSDAEFLQSLEQDKDAGAAGLAAGGSLDMFLAHPMSPRRKRRDSYGQAF
jgi:hypothetical protein